MKIRKKAIIYHVLLMLYVVSHIIIYNKVINYNKIRYVDNLGNVKKSSLVLKKIDKYNYIEFNYIKENIDSEIHFDNVSRKVVISKDGDLIKSQIRSNLITNNIGEVRVSRETVITENKDKYISSKLLEYAYEVKMYENRETLYLYKEGDITAKVKYNKAGLYEKYNKRSVITFHLKKDEEVNVLKEMKDGYVLIKTKDERIGYIPKVALNYVKYKNQENETSVNEKKEVYTYAENIDKNMKFNNVIDAVFLPAFEVIDTSSEIIEKDNILVNINVIKSKGKGCYGILTNGYNLSGFSKNIVSRILEDESKRQILINKILDKTNEYKLNGIVIDFRMLKSEDNANFTQFIKELKVILSANSKKTLISIQGNNYEPYITAVNYSDGAILELYDMRNINSVESGSVASIKWANNILETILKNTNKENVIVRNTSLYNSLDRKI
ncbi:MAG: hypothetical protein PHR25_02445 [Clostridia bacterium]|nr:hypothetical protein [Clostridia bacterium]MDD4375619.1 hypothetical protein [Clostridia bacterium]